MPSDKTKSLGKIIIVVLAMAIFFFLLLPFLEEDAAATQPKAQKAVPQIFTTNPLSELVRTVYSMFARNHKRPALRRESITSIMEQKPFFAFAVPEETRYAAMPEQAPSEANPSTMIDTTYQNYTDAGYINKEGDWVLIRQTAPDAAQRGMHDVNATDKAYDKFLRMERAAKYTAPAQKPASDIPDSKWARLFNPIKKWFTGEEKDKPAATPTESEKAFVLASANAEKNRTGKHPGKYNKALKPDLGNIRVSLPNQTGDKLPVSDLLNPEKVLKDTAEHLKDKAHELLDPQEAEKMEKRIDRQTAISFQQTRQEIEAFAQNQLAKDLAAEQGANIQVGTLIDKTLSCDESAYTSFYKSGQLCSKDLSTAISVETAPLPSLAEAWTAKTGHAPEKDMSLDVVVLLDKTKEMPENLKKQDFTEEKKTFLAFINKPENISKEEEEQLEKEAKRAASQVWMKKIITELYQAQGCDKQPCYWIGLADPPSSVDLRNIVEQADLKYQADPLGLYTKDKMNQLTLAVYDHIDPNDTTENKMLSFGFANNPFPAYVPYTKTQMDELNEREKSTPNFVYFVPSARGVQNMKEVLPNVAQVVYDTPSQSTATAPSAETPHNNLFNTAGTTDWATKMSAPVPPTAGPILDADKETGIQERAQQLQDRTVDHGIRIFNIIDKNAKQLTEQIDQEITEKAAQKVQKEMKQGPGKDIHSTMGL